MAIGTSDGEYFPSHLESVLASLDTSGSTKAPLTPRNTPMEQFRDENDMDLNQPGTDMRRRTMVAQAGPDNKDTTPVPDTRPDLYLDENGQQRSRKNDSVLEQFNPFVDKLAKGLSQSDVDLIDKYHGFESTHGKWTDEDQKRLQPLLDEVEGQVKHLPSSSERIENGQRYIDFHNWDGLLFDKVMKHYKTINPGKRSEADLPENAQPAQYLFSSEAEANKEMGGLTPQESKLYNTHLRNLIGPGGVDNEDGSRSTVLTQISEYDGRYYLIPTVHEGKILNKGEKMSEDANAIAEKNGLENYASYPTLEEAQARYAQLHKYMEKDTQTYQEVQDTYKGVVNWLENNFKTPGQNMQNWSGKEILGYMLSTGLGLVGPGRSPVGGKSGTNLSGKSGIRDISDIHQSGDGAAFNDNYPDTPAFSNLRMSATEMKEYLADRSQRPDTSNMSKAEIDKMTSDWEGSNTPPSAYERALANQKAGRMNPTGDTADEFIKSLREGKQPNLTVVPKEPVRQTYLTKPTKGRAGKEENDNPEPGTPLHRTENPFQEPQAGYKPSQEQIDAQRNQQQEAKVNVGQGKGVLNDNIHLVSAMVSKGMKPSEIAARFDVTPLAVRNWIKRKGGINNIDDILKKRYQDEDK